jgi:hypothetical protein
LDPHWQFLRFVYFDRMYGHKEHADKPVSIPTIEVAGFRERPAKDLVKTAATKAADAAAAQKNVYEKQIVLWDKQDLKDLADKDKAWTDYIDDFYTNVSPNATEVANNAGKKNANDAAAASAATAVNTAQTQLTTAQNAVGTKPADATTAYQQALSAATAKPDSISNWILEPCRCLITNGTLKNEPGSFAIVSARRNTTTRMMRIFPTRGCTNPIRRGTSITFQKSPRAPLRVLPALTRWRRTATTSPSILAGPAWSSPTALCLRCSTAAPGTIYWKSPARARRCGTPTPHGRCQVSQCN